MKKYFVKTPWWLKKLYPYRVWSIETKEKSVYLTFDDGPHPVVTPFVLDELKKYNAKATFFCIGKNITAFPDIYKRIIEEGHQVGNHTHNHLNGWKTPDITYLDDVETAARHIHSTLFRPPYGRIRSAQVKKLQHYRIIMWDLLSGDFDESLSGENCLQNCIVNTNAGSIIVFHDSEKGWVRLNYCLPLFIQHLYREGYIFSKIL